MEEENKLTANFLSQFFNVDRLLDIYRTFFNEKDGLTGFVYDNKSNGDAFHKCLIDFLTDEISNYVTKEELIEKGYITQDDIDCYDDASQQPIYDKVSHYYDSFDNMYSIDAWKIGNDEGEIVATIDADTLSITYIVEEAKGVQSVVDEIKKVMKKFVE